MKLNILSAAAWAVALPAIVAAQSPHAVQFESGIAVFMPTVDMGESLGFSARVQSGVDVHVAALLRAFDKIGTARIGVSVVPATSTHLRPTRACITDCRERSLTTWVITPGFDFLWSLRRMQWFSAVTGAGVSIYAHPGSECTDLIGGGCLRNQRFTQNTARLAFRLGFLIHRNPAGRLSVEANDALIPIANGNLQNDLRIGLSLWF